MTEDQWLSSCTEMVHRLDRDRAMCVMVAPAPERRPLLALLAFNLEIAAIPDLVSEAGLGEIRLQWWRDTIGALDGGAEVGHPVVLGLAEAIAKRGLSKPLFDQYLEARSFDLDGQPPATLAALQSYGDRTAGSLNELMVEALGVGSLAPQRQAAVRTAARQAGLAWALTNLLAAEPYHNRRGRSYLPADVAAEQGRNAVADLARRCIAEARALGKFVPKSMLPVMLSVVLAEYRLGHPARNHPHRTGPGRLFRFYWHLLRGTY